jgi:hypothetical protein
MSGQQIPSGVALRVLMQPLLDKIGPMRQQRQQHYGELFNYIQRFFQLYGNATEKALFGGELYSVVLQFGEILPGDRKADVEYYTALSMLLDERTVLEIMKADGYELDIDLVLQRKAEAAASKAAADQAFMSFQRGVDGGMMEPQLDASGNPIPQGGRVPDATKTGGAQ